MWNDLVTCLKLEPVALEPPPDHGHCAYLGSNQHLPYHRVFGGQILGQLLLAARATFPDKSVKSMHTVFPREGRSDTPIRYEVTTAHEGRSFAGATVTARQDPHVVAAAVVSMHVPEDGRDRQTVPAPGACPGAAHDVEMSLVPWQTRAVVDLDSTAAGPPDYELWMRTPAVDPDLGAALTAYATDLTLIGTALRPEEGLSHTGNGTRFRSAVTSHTLWFHRAVRSDDWQLLRQHSPILAHGRTFGRGDILTADGRLVASFAQEALIRLPN
ncbi:acyl-CoA thioesterase [Skermania piniformis]|nr:acyl-CoA thioesterase domain-containing protein [Skermania piniformis]